MRIADKIKKDFFELISLFTKRKNLIGKTGKPLSAQLLYNSILCLSRLVLCSEVVKFSSNDKRSGFVRNELKRKNNSCITPEARIELSDFDKEYYDLVQKGYIDPNHYERTRLMFFLSEETDLNN